MSEIGRLRTALRELLAEHERDGALPTSGHGHPHEAVETEALSQTIIVDSVRNRLKQLLPEPLGSVQVRASQQRGVIQRALQRLPNQFTG